MEGGGGLGGGVGNSGVALRGHHTSDQGYLERTEKGEVDWDSGKNKHKEETKRGRNKTEMGIGWPGVANKNSVWPMRFEFQI